MFENGIRIGTFGGGAALPILTAAHLGNFEACGLQVMLRLVRSSDELLDHLLGNEIEIAHAAADDIVSWRDSRNAPIVAWIGGSTGRLSLVAQPAISSVEELSGHEIAVDSPASGFVSVLRRALREAGIDGNVTLVPIGGTPLRLDALREHRIAATMLNLPWSAEAIQLGFHELDIGEASDPLLQLGCGASLAGWLADNPRMASAYYRGLIAALTELYAPASREQAIELTREVLNVDSERAALVYGALIDPTRGWPPSAYIDPRAMEAVCGLRAENGRPARLSAAEYYTHGPYREVMREGML